MRYLKQFSILILASIFILGCSKDEETPNDSSSNNNANSNTLNLDEYQFVVSGNNNGVAFTYGYKNGSSNFEYYSSNSYPGSSTCAYANDGGYDAGIGYGVSIDKNLDEKPGFGFEFIRFYLCSNPLLKEEVFNSLFSASDYPYAMSDDSQLVENPKEIEIYFDNSVEYDYYTSLGVSQPATSFFKITSSKESNIYFGTSVISYGQEVEGEFSVKLVNTENPLDVINITNGKFKVTLYN